MKETSRDLAHMTYEKLVAEHRARLEFLVREAKEKWFYGMNNQEYVAARANMISADPSILSRIEAFDREVEPHYREYVSKTAAHFEFYLSLLHT